MVNPFSKFDDYGLRHFPAHLIDIEKWDVLEQILTDLYFVEAKCRVGMTYELVGDNAKARAALPDWQEKAKRERMHLNTGQRYAEEMIAYATEYSEFRKKETRGTSYQTIPKSEFQQGGHISRMKRWFNIKNQPVKSHRQASRKSISHLPLLPQPPAIVNLSGTSKTETDNRSPTVIYDNINAFNQFINSHAYFLAKFSDSDSFCIQEAFNYADGGPVAEQARLILAERSGTPLILRINRAEFMGQSDDKTLLGHSSSIEVVRITANGRRAVSAAHDDTIRVWDVETGECERVIRTPDAVFSLNITPDGQWAVSGDLYGEKRVWDLATGACERVLEDSDKVTSEVKGLHISVTPDATRAAAGSVRGAIKIWSLETGACERVLQGHQLPDFVVITPDGQQVITTGKDRMGDDYTDPYESSLKVWDLTTGICKRALTDHTTSHTPLRLSITPDARRAISGGSDGSITVWNLETGKREWVLNGDSEVPRAVRALSITPDGRRAATVRWSEPISIWNLTTGVCERVLRTKDNTEALDITPDGRWVISGSYEGTITVWDLTRNAKGPAFTNKSKSALSICLTPDEEKAFVGCDDGAIQIWRLSTQQCEQVLLGHTDSVYPLRIAPDGKKIVSSGGPDGTIMAWNMATGVREQVFSRSKGRNSYRDFFFTPDGTTLVVPEGQAELTFWNFDTGKQKQQLQLARGWNLVGLCVSENLTRAVVWDDATNVNEAPTLSFWNVTSGECEHAMPYVTHIDRMSISPDGRKVVLSETDGCIRIFNVHTGQCIHKSEDQTSRAFLISISPDSRTFVSANGAVTPSDDATIRIWDLETGECKHEIGHGIHADQIFFTSDGKRIIVGFIDGTVQIWDVDAGSLINTTLAGSRIRDCIFVGDYFLIGTLKDGLIFNKVTNLW